jgi:hypothetical protein
LRKSYWNSKTTKKMRKTRYLTSMKKSLSKIAQRMSWRTRRIKKSYS